MSGVDGQPTPPPDGKTKAIYRLVAKNGRGRQRTLKVPQDVVLLDVACGSRLEVVRIVSLHDSESGWRGSGVVVRRAGEGVMLVTGRLLHDLALGRDINDVLAELPVWVG